MDNIIFLIAFAFQLVWAQKELLLIFLVLFIGNLYILVRFFKFRVTFWNMFSVFAFWAFIFVVLGAVFFFSLPFGGSSGQIQKIK